MLDLYAIGRHLAGWVGDVGRAFEAADTDGDGRVDDSQLSSVERLGNGTFTVMEVNGRIVIDTGDGDDEVTVVAVDGGIRVTVNGVEQVFTGVTAGSVILRLGGGDDVIEVGTDVDVRFTLEGQTGDDRLEGGAGDETIRGGDGRDYIDGFSGDDDIEGGEGHDVVYAGDGDDVVRGGDGRDYLDGGEGADTVLGGDLADIVAGGDGADTLDGEGGDDVVYAGGGDDRVVDHGGDNTVYAQTDDDVDRVMGESTSRVITIDLSGLPGDSALRIEGSPRFQQRMLADLDMLRSSPTGRGMLLALDDIHEDTKAIAADWPVLGARRLSGRHGRAARVRGHRQQLGGLRQRAVRPVAVERDPPEPGHRRDVPGVVHPVGHDHRLAADPAGRGAVPRDGAPVRLRLRDHDRRHVPPSRAATPTPSERQAVGLPVDHDGDAATPPIVDPDHPIKYTENGLRREMGLPDRETYLRP